MEGCTDKELSLSSGPLPALAFSILLLESGEFFFSVLRSGLLHICQSLSCGLVPDEKSGGFRKTSKTRKECEGASTRFVFDVIASPNHFMLSEGEIGSAAILECFNSQTGV